MSDELTKMMEQTYAMISQHPLLKRYVSMCGQSDYWFSTDLPSHRLPWQAQGHKLFAAWMLSADTTSTDGSIGDASEETAEDIYAIHSQGLSSLLAAQVYLWTNEMYEVAAEMPIPRHTIPADILPYNQMFWSMENSKSISLDANTFVRRNNDFSKLDIDSSKVSWYLIYKALDGIAVLGGVLAGKNQGWHFDIFGIKTNCVYPDDFTESQRPAVARILAMLAFLNSPYINVSLQKINRSARRELERAGYQKDSEVLTSVVTLRREAIDPSIAKDDTPTGIIRRHKWWVSGHIRAQWYPSQSAHRLIWIAPHLKGPVDAPLIEKTYVVSL